MTARICANFFQVLGRKYAFTKKLHWAFNVGLQILLKLDTMNLIYFFYVFNLFLLISAAQSTN